MQGKLTVITADGMLSRKDYHGPIPLEDLQNAVGGYIQIVPGFDKYKGKRCVAFINEEGKLDGLPYNEFATTMWMGLVGSLSGDYIVGSIAIVTGDKAFMRAL
jgi:hypothetical protein